VNRPGFGGNFLFGFHATSAHAQRHSDVQNGESIVRTNLCARQGRNLMQVLRARRTCKVTGLIAAHNGAEGEPVFVDMPNSGRPQRVSGAHLRWSAGNHTQCE
jgi:hypothetical protein